MPSSLGMWISMETDIQAQLPRLEDDVLAVARGRDELEVGIGLEDAAERAAHQGGVVGGEDADLRSWCHVWTELREGERTAEWTPPQRSVVTTLATLSSTIMRFPPSTLPMPEMYCSSTPDESDAGGGAMSFWWRFST